MTKLDPVALPEPRLWYDPETQTCSITAPLRPTYESLWDADDLRAYAAQEVAEERKRWSCVYNGMSVWRALSEIARNRLSYDDVSDVLDAVATLARQHDKA